MQCSASLLPRPLPPRQHVCGCEVRLGCAACSAKVKAILTSQSSADEGVGGGVVYWGGAMRLLESNQVGKVADSKVKV